MKQYINGIEVKPTNYKKYAALLDAYRGAVNMYGYRYLLDCYDKPSGAKRVAEGRIVNEMLERNGYGYTITSYNSTVFLLRLPLPAPRRRQPHSML